MNIFKKFLLNIIFPERSDNQSLIISFVGVPGVGKSTLSHNLRFHKLSRYNLGYSSASKIVKYLGIPMSEEYKKYLIFSVNIQK